MISWGKVWGCWGHWSGLHGGLQPWSGTDCVEWDSCSLDFPSDSSPAKLLFNLFLREGWAFLLLLSCPSWMFLEYIQKYNPGRGFLAEFWTFPAQSEYGLESPLAKEDAVAKALLSSKQLPPRSNYVWMGTPRIEAWFECRIDVVCNWTGAFRNNSFTVLAKGRIYPTIFWAFSTWRLTSDAHFSPSSSFKRVMIKPAYIPLPLSEAAVLIK